MTAFMAVGKTQNLEMENTWKTQALVVMMAVTAVAGTAQVTYNHDSSKKNQVTVMEVGKGTLTPDAYYWLLHNDYRQSASSRNKLSYRTLAAGNLYKQVDDAELIDSSLTKRAEIEALNVADRQIDLAWAAEGDKINDKLADFERNISRILELVFRSSLHKNTRRALNSIAGEIHLVHIEGQRSEWSHFNGHCPHFRHHILVAAIPFAENAELDGHRTHIRLAPLLKNIALKLGIGKAL